MKAGTRNLKGQYLHLNFCLKINEYVDDMKLRIETIVHDRRT